MAERRMFAKTIIDSDAFIDMPTTARLLYYDLGMRADDDGFVNSPKKIMRMIGASEDDMKILIAKKFIIPFESGVVVIKHWRINNYLRSDRYKKTTYQEEKEQLTVKENGAYSLDGIPMVDLLVDHRYPKDSIGEVRLDKGNNDICQSSLQDVIDKWNSTGFPEVKYMASSSKRASHLKQRIKEHGLETVLEAIDIANSSQFLHGNNKDGWTMTFDWFVKPSNFIKVLEHNYDNRRGQIEKTTESLKDMWEGL